MSRGRAFRKRVSSLTGQTGFFSGKRAPEALLGGMPLAADVCGKCGERPGDLTCCACAASICARCSTLTGDALARAQRRPQPKTKKRCRSSSAGVRRWRARSRCGVPATRRKRPLKSTVVGAGLNSQREEHHFAAVNCDLGPTIRNLSRPAAMVWVAIVSTRRPGRIDDQGPGRDSTTAGAAKISRRSFERRGEVLIEKGSGRRQRWSRATASRPQSFTRARTSPRSSGIESLALRRGGRKASSLARREVSIMQKPRQTGPAPRSQGLMDAERRPVQVGLRGRGDWLVRPKRSQGRPTKNTRRHI